MKEEIKFVSWNIDTNIGRMEEGLARETHPMWRIHNRMKSIQEEILKLSPDILQIQEARAFTNKFGEVVDSVTPLVDFLREHGYEVQVGDYNPTDKAFKYITAYKIDRFESTGSKLKYFTKTPDAATDHTDHQNKLTEIKEHNYGDEWERCTFIVSLKDKVTGDFISAFNVHLNISEMHRLKASELLIEFVREELNNYPNNKIVIAGDFNSFPDRKGEEQIKFLLNNEIAKDKYLTELSDKLYLEDGVPVKDNTTFIAFPYDFVPKAGDIRPLTTNLPNLEPLERKVAMEKIFVENCKALGGQLDHILTSGFKTQENVILKLTSQYIPAPSSYTEESVMSYIIEHLNDGPAFASDHQPLEAILIGVDASAS
jgi:endonuclease/exonuclease/phosphatase family metal-dependent hydrolase